MKKFLFPLIFLLASVANAAVQYHTTPVEIKTPSNYFIRCSAGYIEGCSFLTKFGGNQDLDDADGFQTLWAAGPIAGNYVPLTTGQSLELFSSDGTDTENDVGCRSFTITGLDENWDEITETILSSGTFHQTTTEQFIFVQRVKCVSAGSNTNNAGNISAIGSVDLSTQAYILSDIGITEQVIFAVPNNKMGFILFERTSAVKTAGGQLPIIRIRNFETEESGVTHIHDRDDFDTNTQNKSQHPSVSGQPLEEKTILEIRVDTDKDNTVVYGHFDILFLDIE